MRHHPPTDPPNDPLGDLSVLAHSVRRELYDYVASQDEPVSREDAATSVGISRTLAAYHLDHLAKARLLTISYARDEGKTGPGSGRPAKRYARVQDEVAASVPPRDYGVLARILADTVAGDTTGALQEALMATAEREGISAGSADADVMVILRERGYEPVLNEAGDVEMRNCPFHQLSERHTELVCGVNYALLRGVLSGCCQDPDRAELAPRATRCCVVIHPAEIGITPIDPDAARP